MGNNIVGSKVKYFRKKFGITQAELAAALGYKDHSSIGRIEDGSNDVPISVIGKIANIVGVSPVEFFKGPADEIDEYIPYMENAEEWQLKAIREILHMDSKKESASNYMKKAN